MKKFLMLTLLGAFVAGVVAEGAFAQKKKKKRKKRDPEALFKRLDKDGNGHVNKEEFVSRRKGKGKERAEKVWTRISKNAKDAEKGLTLEEFKKAFTRKKKKKKKKKDA